MIDKDIKLSEIDKEALTKLNQLKYSVEGKFYNFEASSILNLIENYKKQNEELKQTLIYVNNYKRKLEEDLFNNCSNYVISKEEIKKKINEVFNEDLELDEKEKYLGNEIKRYIISKFQDLLEGDN